MGKKIIGFSGSPIKNSNTDRAVQAVMDASGMESEFVKLSSINVRPCIACNLCLDDNRCSINDDFPALAEKMINADAIVFGAYTPYNMIDAFTKSLIERLYSTRHNRSVLAGKACATITTSLMTSYAPEVLEAINKLFNESLAGHESMNLVGNVSIQGNMCCAFCGKGDECENSAVRMLGQMTNNPELKADDCEYVDYLANPDCIKQIEDIGKKLAETTK